MTPIGVLGTVLGLIVLLVVLSLGFVAGVGLGTSAFVACAFPGERRAIAMRPDDPGPLLWAWIAGVANWRGRIMPVLDLRVLLGAPVLELGVTGRVVFLGPVADVRRALRMFETVAVPVLGIVENMSYFIAPDTGARYNIFGEGGGRKLAETYGVPFLGAVPLGLEVREGGDAGVPVVIGQPDSPQSEAFRHVAEEVARQVSIEAMKPELKIVMSGA